MAFSHSWPAKYLLPCAFSSTDSSLAPMFEYYQIRYVELRACNCFNKSLCPKNNWVKIMTLGKFLQDRCWLILGPIFQPTVRASLVESFWNSSSVTFLNLRQSHTAADGIEMSAFVPGSQQRYLRACMVCSIVQTHNVCTSSHWFLRSQAVYSNMLTISLL